MIGEASLPDVDSRYFIHSPATAAEHFRQYGPAPIDGEPIALVFASDGGSHLFAIGASGQVWKSTTASWFDDFEVTASSLVPRTARPPDREPDLIIGRGQTGPCPRRSFHSWGIASRCGDTPEQGVANFKESSRNSRHAWRRENRCVSDSLSSVLPGAL
ncbi:hypothetical protein ACFV80_35560, partial [Streptomyces sp. NPDC059862]